MDDLKVRMQRLRAKPALRDLTRETELNCKDFILPIFVDANVAETSPIASLPGQEQWSIKALPRMIECVSKAGIPAILLFGNPAHKDAQGSESYAQNGIVQQAVACIKEQNPELVVICDACLCQYTENGHCGIVDERRSSAEQVCLDNDTTLELLAKQALSFAAAGADMIAPSGMIDGMVAAIRESLDSNGFSHLPILSYAAKYCSAFYGPFREATGGSAPKSGDRSSYQMDPANSQEALREVALDVAEGADLLMVKPAGNYLDIICRVKDAYPELPLAAYQVSGEYAMLKMAASQGLLDERRAALESLLAIKRAGADMIISYFALQVSEWL